MIKLFATILRTLFHLLYHQFAWTYDLVAAVVSLGQWNEWVRSTLPYLEGRVLEIGYGPGHLQQELNDKGMTSFGVDESRQMARQAGKRLKKAGLPVRLTRGLAQSLPYAGGSFDRVVVTFPSEYIYDQKTLQEARRVLNPSGVLVIVPMAWITGTHILERLPAGLFRLTGEVPGEPRPLPAAVEDQFHRAGFEVRSELVQVRHSEVLVIVAKRTRF